MSKKFLEFFQTSDFLVHKFLYLWKKKVYQICSLLIDSAIGSRMVYRQITRLQYCKFSSFKRFLFFGVKLLFFLSSFFKNFNQQNLGETPEGKKQIWFSGRRNQHAMMVFNILKNNNTFECGAFLPFQYWLWSQRRSQKSFSGEGWLTQNFMF